MSGLRFKTGVCRECKHEWDLDKTYTKAAVLEHLKALAVCPKCKGIRCSFPYVDAATAPAKPEALSARGKPELAVRKPKKPLAPPKKPKAVDGPARPLDVDNSDQEPF